MLLLSDIERWFEHHSKDDEFCNFDAIPLKERLSDRRDVHAIMLMDRLSIGLDNPTVLNIDNEDPLHKIIFEVDLTKTKMTEQDVLALVRCGCGFDEGKVYL